MAEAGRHQGKHRIPCWTEATHPERWSLKDLVLFMKYRDSKELRTLTPSLSLSS